MKSCFNPAVPFAATVSVHHIVHYDEHELLGIARNIHKVELLACEGDFPQEIDAKLTKEICKDDNIYTNIPHHLCYTTRTPVLGKLKKFDYVNLFDQFIRLPIIPKFTFVS